MWYKGYVVHVAYVVKERACHVLKHEKAVRALDAAFAHFGPKAYLNEHFQRSLGPINQNFGAD